MRLLFAAAAFSLLAAAPASATPDEAAERACFASSNWNGWSAVEDGDALYLRVSNNDIYRVELAPGSHVRERGGQFLVSEVRGSNYICSALDLDLKLADQFGFQRPLFPRSLRRLTPEEVAAIPQEDRP